MIIYGTGFKTVEAVAELNVAGRDGVKLQDVWRDGVEAYHGITVPGFPNFFLLLGPNTGLGHNSVDLHDRKPGPARAELPAAAGQGGRRRRSR